jgi:tight adherence protein B
MGFVVLSFFGTLTFILGVYWLFVVRPERQTQEAVWKRLKGAPGPSPRVRASIEKQVQRLSAVPSLNAVLERGREGVRPIELLIEQSGNTFTVGTFLLASATIGLLVGSLVYWLTATPLLGLAAGLPAAWIPTGVLRFQRTRRVLKFEEQFPEALALISRALKAGHTFTTGLAMVGEELPAPIGHEFKLLYDQQNYGMPLPEALREFAKRVPLLDARFFVTAVLIQRESGGNLSEVLENIATVMRDRFRVKRQIRVISAHARMTGMVLIGTPPTLALILILINPDHLDKMLGTELGVQLIVGAIIMQIVGSLIIRKLIRIEY